MAIVPIYKRNQKLVGSHRANFTVRANADQMGAAIGRGMQGLARGVETAGDAIFAAQEQDQATQAKDRHNQYMTEKDRLLYDPQHGYLNQKGNNAVVGYDKLQEDLSKLRSKYSEGLSGSALEKFNNAADVTERQGLRSGMVHAGNQRNANIQQVHAERMDAFGSQIANAYDDEEARTQYLNAGLAEIQVQAENEGWTDEQVRMRSDIFRSGSHKGVIASMAMKDPYKAHEYFEKNKAQLTAKDRLAVEGVLQPIIQEADDNALIQQSMTTITGGEPQIYGTDGMADYLNRMGWAEASGKADAKSKSSSAEGLAQFIDGTWDDMRRLHPELELTPDGRTDPKQAIRAARQFTINNAKELTKNGIPISASNLYAAHFLGVGGSKSAGAIQVLTANDSQMMRDIVSKQKIDANPFLRDMNVHEFKMWSAHKMGVAPNVSPEKVRVIYGLKGKVRDKPVQDHVVSQMTTAAAATDPRISIRVKSGGQDPFGTGYKRTGSTRHDHGGAADIVLQIDGKDVKPGDNPELYARFLENAAAAGMTGLGHYKWGIHVGGGDQAAWGPDTTGASLDPLFAKAIQAGWDRAKSGGGPIRGFAPVGNAAAIELALQKAKNPAQRARLQKRLKAAIAAQERQKKARTNQAKTDGLDFVLKGNSPSNLPHSSKLLIGQEGLKGLHSLYEQQAYKGDVTDPVTYARLMRMSAENPAEFAAQELFSDEILSKLSQSDFKALVKTQTDITKGALKAKADGEKSNAEAIATGKVYKDAYRQADTALDAVGITTSGYSGAKSRDDREKQSKKIAEFQIALKKNIDQHISRNEGAVPEYNDIQKMINRLLFDAVIRDRDEGWFGDGYLDEWAPEDKRFLFEASKRPDGTVVEALIEYEDIPVDDRKTISRYLELQKGAKPKPEEVVEYYKSVFL